ncbi:MAG: nitroreductase family protein [Acidimicrobiales bacterium]
MASAAHLAENLERVPVLVMVSIWGEHDGSGRPGLFDSVIQAAWSFCLALRARGLGTAWTTMHLQAADEVRDLFHVPDGVTQVVLLPVAHTIGTEFHPAPRIPARAITYVDSWGATLAGNADGPVTFAAGPGVTVEIDVDAPPKAVWPFVSDPICWPGGATSSRAPRGTASWPSGRPSSAATRTRRSASGDHQPHRGTRPEPGVRMGGTGPRGPRNVVAVRARPDQPAGPDCGSRCASGRVRRASRGPSTTTPTTRPPSSGVGRPRTAPT